MVWYGIMVSCGVHGKPTTIKIIYLFINYHLGLGINEYRGKFVGVECIAVRGIPGDRDGH